MGGCYPRVIILQKIYKPLLVGLFKMENKSLDMFYSRMSKLKSHDKPNFLHGVYKQLVVSHKGRRANGEYKTLTSGIHEMAKCGSPQPWADFILAVTDELNNHRMPNHAARLLEQEKLTDPYNIVSHLMQEIPNLRDYGNIIFHGTSDGTPKFQLKLGKFGYQVSIIVDRFSSDIGRTLYEIQPILDGKGLIELYLFYDDVVRGVELRKTLEITQATLSGDKDQLRKTLDQIV